MRRKRLISWLILAIMLVVPLLTAGVSAAESGCHKGSGSPPKTGSPNR